MALAVDRLPSDPARLRAIIVEQSAALAAKEAELHTRDLLVEKLKAQLAVLRRARLGASSEKLARSIAQLELALEETEGSEAAVAAQTDRESVRWGKGLVGRCDLGGCGMIQQQKKECRKK